MEAKFNYINNGNKTKVEFNEFIINSDFEGGNITKVSYK